MFELSRFSPLNHPYGSLSFFLPKPEAFSSM